MIINLVVAAAENNVIGKDNKLLWHLPNDLAFFKNITWGMPVIMGRKTFESLGRPLKGRTNIVISKSMSLPSTEQLVFVKGLQEAVLAAEKTDARECYIIGGGEIYKQSMAVAERIYLTRVLAQLEGDTYFPVIDPKEWALKNSTSFDSDAKHAFPYCFEVWEKKEAN